MKKTNRSSFLYFLRIFSNVIWYTAIGMSIIAFLLIAITFFSPEYVQDKIFVPIEFSIRDTNNLSLSNNLVINSDLYNITAADITYNSKDLYIIRGFLSYTFIILAGISLALFFWRKLLNSFEYESFFSKENRSMVNFFGWLLIVYSFLFSFINLFFKAFIDYRIHEDSLTSSFGHNLSINIFLIILGLLFILMSKIRCKSESR